MLARPPASISREAVSLSLDAALLRDAEALGVDLATIAERALRTEIGAEKARRWAEENKDAIAFNNRKIAEEGLWSDGLRLF